VSGKRSNHRPYEGRVRTSDATGHGVRSERLKRSIKEEGRLLLPIVLNQDNVILDGHHRFQACQELGIPIRIDKKHFTGRPLDEMMYVVNVNLYRRSLNDFQRVEVGIRVEELRRKLGQHQQEASRFTPETSQEAHREISFR